MRRLGSILILNPADDWLLSRLTFVLRSTVTHRSVIVCSDAAEMRLLLKVAEPQPALAIVDVSAVRIGVAQSILDDLAETPVVALCPRGNDRTAWTERTSAIITPAMPMEEIKTTLRKFLFTLPATTPNRRPAETA